MFSLYEDPYFTFRFAEARRIDRIHLDGVVPGRRVILIALDPRSGQRRNVLAEVESGEDGWVYLDPALIVQAEDTFIALISQSSFLGE